MGAFCEILNFWRKASVEIELLGTLMTCLCYVRGSFCVMCVRLSVVCAGSILVLCVTFRATRSPLKRFVASHAQYIYIYTYINVCIHIHIYIYIHTSIYLHIHVHINNTYMNMYREICSSFFRSTNMNIYKYLYIYTYLDMYVHVYVYAYEYVYVYMYINEYISYM